MSAVINTVVINPMVEVFEADGVTLTEIPREFYSKAVVENHMRDSGMNEADTKASLARHYTRMAMRAQKRNPPDLGYAKQMLAAALLQMRDL